jgi:hypothetical protein
MQHYLLKMLHLEVERAPVLKSARKIIVRDGASVRYADSAVIYLPFFRL